MYACCNDRCISISSCLWLAIQSLWELPRGRLWTHPKHWPLSHIRGGSECAKNKGFYPRKVNNETTLGPAHGIMTDPQHNFNSISLKWMSLHCSNSPEMAKGWMGHYLVITNNYTLLEPWLHAAVWTAENEQCVAGAEEGYTEFLWFSEFSCQQAADSLQGRLDQFLSASSHCTLFNYRIHVYWKTYCSWWFDDSNDILRPDDTCPLSGLCDHAQVGDRSSLPGSHLPALCISTLFTALRSSVLLPVPSIAGTESKQILNIHFSF